jgi:glyoxylase-like metal-dependent hydrolase (beta-lactamase superfamily II)
MAPSGHAVDVRGMPFQEVRYTRYEAGAADARAMFDLPQGDAAAPSAPAAAAPGLPATGEVAPGVHVLNLRSFVVMLVEFRDFVVALEAPETHPGLEAIPAAEQDAAGLVTEDYIAAITRLFPSKPVRLVAVSHHHGDHIGGVRAFAAKGIAIAAPPATAAAIRNLLAQPADPRQGAPGAVVANPSVEVVNGRRIVSDGWRTLELVDVGPNPHTSENLVAWLPRERILFQGDLFYFAEGAPFPPSGRGTMNRFFAAWLSARGLAPRAIYGVHNRGAAGPEALAASVR